ncbi:MAG TPA: hypothetical protein VE991_11640, partial [Acidimicrobiales bacterium]|nr:hypothetical protein [Acidimicrobiales bacterium]
NPNLNGIQSDIASITQVGRTLDRNLGSLDQGLSSSVALFAAAQRAYDPVHKWLVLNTQLAPDTTTGVLEGLVRDRLAGICRRVLANHSSGMSQSAITTLQTCGNPNSGFFDAILGLVPTALNAATGSQPPAPSPQDLLGKGVAQIPGLSASQQSALSSVQPSALATTSTTAPSLGGPSLGTTPPLVNDQQANGSSGGLLGGLVHGLLGVAHFFGSVGHVFGSVGRMFGSVAKFFGSLA